MPTALSTSATSGDARDAASSLASPVDAGAPEGALAARCGARRSAVAAHLRDACAHLAPAAFEALVDAVCVAASLTPSARGAGSAMWLEPPREAPAGRHAGRLLRLSGALAGATTVTGAADAALATGLEVLEAATGGLYLVDPATGAAVLAASRGFSPDVVAGFGAIPADAPVPVAAVARTGEAVILRAPAEMAARYPELAPVWEQMATRALVVLPLVAGDRVTGTLGYAFPEPREISDEELAFATAVAQQASQALERARLFEAEHRARQDAERANQIKVHFLATISHELRTPLNAIGGYAQLLELGVRGPVTPAQAEDLRRIQQSQQHLIGLLDRVLDYARVEAGRVQFAPATLPLADALAGAEALVAPLLRAKDLTYEMALCGRPCTAWADPEKVRQILVNLLTNATKFTPAGGRITVRCAAAVPPPAGADAARGWVALRVEDTGVGIAPADLTRVFEPFAQVRHASAPRDGVGLGLAIGRDLARGMGGDLTVESTLGVGSTFTLVLPAAS